MFGYIFFFLTALFYVGLAMLSVSRPNMAGDNAMGYGLMLIFLGIGFAVSSLLLTIALLNKGAFQWVLPGSGVRTGLVLLSWLLIAATTFSCALFKWEWHADTLYPQFLHALAVRNGQLWIPLLWLGVCFVSLNSNWQAGLLPRIYIIPFWVSLGIGLLYGAGLVTGFLRESDRSAKARIAEIADREDHYHQQHLAEIAAHKPGDPLINILVFTNRFQYDDVRTAALAKIKARPDWEAELLNLLNNKHYYREVYTFLDGNRVDYPERFVNPLNQTLLWMAEDIPRRIKDSNNLQDWSFDNLNIDRALRAIDEQFVGLGVDFYPTVVRLHQALNTTPPEQFKGVRFKATDQVEAWLKQHRK